ncbi:RIP metalloprotease RseP [Solidesulfovibrio sp.]|jgi:regulator of sigma E protease|uniref:RIP metalloprotease RseP n=1 Tax=Solidesulfovibrio sp. TaxID=2910990 RepID=UPI002B2183E4|nr:RIP metalloprotease RseP [Solidesulfovibrio sp.]MEA5089079.1 RIP metalloprotease RseP [Solidesulfovibrio sp.]HML62962.1 RIP metalloprotease RseP [Solidesulfovibrio sp.]
MIASILAVALVLGGLIFFHELGHFLAARAFGMGVVTFSLGFGPKLLGFRRGMTSYVLSAIPLGGYVQLVAQDPDDPVPDGFPPEAQFRLRPAWQRMIVVAAGPVFNFVLAWLLFWGLLVAEGRFEMLPVVGQVQKDSPAETAGVRPGDTVLTVAGAPVANWESMAQAIRGGGGKPVDITVDREGKTLTFSLTPAMRTVKNLFGEEESAPLVGIVASGKTRSVPLGPGTAAGEAVRQTWNVVVVTYTGLLKLIERVVPLDSLGGPIMIAQMVSKQASEGLGNVVALAALISVNLGVLNLLPIPVLDGGHLLFYAIEIVLRRPVSPRMRALTTKIGLAFLIGLMILATVNDIRRQMSVLDG